MSEDMQAVWKRIKVPAELSAAGWKLVRRDTSAPFSLVNKKLDLDTGGFPDPTEAINAANVLVAEAAAIVADGAEVATVDNGARPVVLPAMLIDEGWRLHRRRSGQHYADRDHGSPNMRKTADYADPADAVGEAILIEIQRQAEIEARETGAAVGPAGGAYAEFIKHGQDAQHAVDQTIADFSTSDETAKEATANGNGHQDITPAEVVLALDLIRTDGGTQQRSLFDPVVVEDYAEALSLEGADHFPAVDVFFDGSDYWLADGFYRVAARRQLNLDAVPAHVRQGSQRDAILWSLGANARHGLRRTPEDKRRAVLVVLRDPEWCTWSDNYIAERVKVSAPFVRKLRRQVSAETTGAGDSTAVETSADTGETSTPPATTKRRGRDGVVRDTARIGTHATEDADDEQLALDTGEVAETAPANKNENAGNTPAAVHLCSDCDKEIGAGDFESHLGQCWDCTPKLNAKEPAKPQPAKPAARTFADLGATVPIKLSLYFMPAHGRRVLVSITGGARTADHDLGVTEVDLPPAIFDLVKLHLTTLRVAKKLATAKKPATKAPAKPTRKPAAVAHLKRKPTTKTPAGKKIVPGHKTKTTPAPVAKKKSREVGPTKRRGPAKKK